MTLGALVAVTGFMDSGLMATRAAVELPVRALKITFSKSAREEFVAQIKKFADDHAFDIRVSQSTPAPEDTLVHMRSEEHTSELQSLMRISYAVFCLKKKKI